jgi:hypothetical protein
LNGPQADLTRGVAFHFATYQSSQKCGRKNSAAAAEKKIDFEESTEKKNNIALVGCLCLQTMTCVSLFFPYIHNPSNTYIRIIDT